MTPIRWHNIADAAARYDATGVLDAERAHYFAQATIDLVALVRALRGADPPDPRERIRATTTLRPAEPVAQLGLGLAP